MNKLRKKTYYEILEIPSTATDNEVREAFRKRSNELHPDGRAFKSSAGGTEKFMELKEAFDVLKTSTKRAQYDRELEFGREAAREMFFETPSDSSKANVIELQLRSPRSRLQSVKPRQSLSARVGHFFDPAKAVAFEEQERRRVIWFVVFFIGIIAADVVYIHYLRAKKVSTA